jgi:heat shock protein HtpX
VNRNWLRTVVVVSVPAGAAMAAGAILGGPAGMAVAVAVVGLVSCPALFLADRMALSAMWSRPVGEVEYPELYRAAREVSRAARLPVPRVHVSPALQPNSFTIGRSRRTATVCCTEGLIRLLTADELRAVLGHELAQVRERDTSATSLVAGLAAVITSLASPAWFLPPGRARLSFLGETPELEARELDEAAEVPGAGWAARAAMLILGPVAALLLQAAVSRAREYQADARGAALAGGPLALASALRKIEARTVELPLYPTGPLASASPLMIVNPFSGGGFARLFSTHPPTGERVFRLEALAGYPR